MSEDTKQCPYCAETIKTEAVVCRFCGRDLTTPLATVPRAAPPKKRGCFWRVLRWGAYIGVGSLALGLIINTVQLAGESAGIFPTRTPTFTPTMTPTPTITPTPTDTPTPTNTSLPTDTPTITPTPLPTNTPTITPTPTNTPAPTNTPLPTNTPTSTPIPSLQQRISSVLTARDSGATSSIEVKIVADVIQVQWPLNSGFDTSWVRTGAMMDAANILRTIHEAVPDYQLIMLIGTFTLVDRFGNESDPPVMWLEISKETMEKINWADEDFTGTLFYKRIPDIADKLKYHPAMLKD